MRDYRRPPAELTPEQKQKLKRCRNRARRLASLSKKESDSSAESEDDEPIVVERPADPKLRALVRNFFNTFQGTNVMKSVYGLDIAGMIDHTDGEHKGHCSILYKLPGTSGVQNRQRPAENLKLRAPVTLKFLLGTKQQQGIRSTLGARFELARNLVRAVCLLHSSGWLHKNIRAEAVMFFPEHVNALQEDRYEVKIEIDVSKPILMGYIFSRPDDISRPDDSIIMIPANPLEQTEPEPEPESESESGVQRLPVRSKVSKTWDDPMDQLPAKSKRIIGTPRADRMYGQSEISKTWDDPLNRLLPKSKRRIVGTPRADGIYGRNAPNEPTTVPERTKDIKISGFTLDYYQHPAKHADPMRQYCHAYDVHSLGLLLLGVRLWEELSGYTIRNIDDEEEDHYERRRRICRDYLDRLRWACGDTYANVVLRCIMVDSTDDEIAKASERQLCARIVADLEGCRA
ncbi:hypothetical protein B0H66DRAFT_555578 [Apodospora peruviana]|uniref:Protein kinase domain-containing protein n=1 Tax=Apodospora peruviana TaxID=516989 RepID=A0AAE0IDW0_9PEZI|nr:hypothetical protein B0H66DRAFT_555578 [Apodospora peruviana]